MFQGASSLTLDAKGRLSVPTRHRAVLSVTAAGQFTLTKHPHSCLMGFPRSAWEPIAAWSMSAQWWKRMFLGHAMDVEMDGTGCIFVSPEWCSAAGVVRDILLLGMDNPLSCGARRLTTRRRPKRCRATCLTSSKIFLSLSKG